MTSLQSRSRPHPLHFPHQLSPGAIFVLTSCQKKNNGTRGRTRRLQCFNTGGEKSLFLLQIAACGANVSLGERVLSFLCHCRGSMAMPPAYVETIHEEIFYEYAKLISRSAYGKIEYAFVAERFRRLRDGQITISGTIREWEREQELPHRCVYCKSSSDLTSDHLIPLNRGGDESADNVVAACRSCNTSRGDKGIFEWLGLESKDDLHRLVAGKYLQQLLSLHEEVGTLGISKDRITTLCRRCSLPEVCERWGTSRQLTCFCLESILPPGNASPG